MSSNPSAPCSRDVWMGGISKAYMTETFVLAAFLKMGQKPLSVKFNKKKKPGEPPGFCYVRFSSEEEVKKALNDLRGKIIPNSIPPARFFLNKVGCEAKHAIPRFSVWLVDLSPDVDDSTLLKAFTTRFQSCIKAKVILDMTGHSRGVGHVTFTNEEDQNLCLRTMNGFRGLGTKPLKLSSTLPQSICQTFSSSSSSSGGGGSSSSPGKIKGTTQDLNSKFERSYWQNYAAWQNSLRDSIHSNFAAELTTMNILDTVVEQENDLELIDHNTKVDIDSWNREMIQRDYNLWDALECSKWLPPNMLE